MTSLGLLLLTFITSVIMVFAMFCMQKHTEVVKSKYRLSVEITTEAGVKDTLSCTYSAIHKIEPQLIDNTLLNDHCKLYMGENNWSVIIANMVTHYKVLSNEKYN